MAALALTGGYLSYVVLKYFGRRARVTEQGADLAAASSQSPPSSLTATETSGREHEDSGSDLDEDYKESGSELDEDSGSDANTSKKRKRAASPQSLPSSLTATPCDMAKASLAEMVHHGLVAPGTGVISLVQRPGVVADLLPGGAIRHGARTYLSPTAFATAVIGKSVRKTFAAVTYNGKSLDELRGAAVGEIDVSLPEMVRRGLVAPGAGVISLAQRPDVVADLSIDHGPPRRPALPTIRYGTATYQSPTPFVTAVTGSKPTRAGAYEIVTYNGVTLEHLLRTDPNNSWHITRGGFWCPPQPDSDDDDAGIGGGDQGQPESDKRRAESPPDGPAPRAS